MDVLPEPFVLPRLALSQATVPSPLVYFFASSQMPLWLCQQGYSCTSRMVARGSAVRMLYGTDGGLLLKSSRALWNTWALSSKSPFCPLATKVRLYSVGSCFSRVPLSQK